MKSKKFSIVVPVFNSEETLALLITRLTEVMQTIASEYEIILVNDGSADNGWATIQQLASQDPHLVGIDLMRNYGQHNALLCGIREAQYDVIITIDDDLQNPPREIPKLIAKLDEGFDVVYGVPVIEQHGFFRDINSQLIKIFLQKAMGVRIARYVSAFRAFTSISSRAFAEYNGMYVSIDVLLSWGTTRFSSVLVDHEPRTHGRSNYSFGKLLTHAFTLVTGFSIIPLRLASILGFFFVLFGFGVLLYVLIAYLIHGKSIPGFPFLASIISIFSGVQLFTLGIFGEYLGRIFTRSLDRPSYTIRSHTTDKARSS